MNELLQKHGCSNVFTIPEGLKELMSDITREVLREQPPQIFEFIANYLSVLLITREHGVMAVKILDDLCDCRPSVSEHLLQLCFERKDAEILAQVIKEEIEEIEPVEGREKVRETQILKKILKRNALDEEMSEKVCQVARNAYRDFWYRKKMLEQSMKESSEEPWEIAAQRTLEIYKNTKPSFSELTRATQKIQAAYRGYHVRRNLLRNLKPRKKSGPKVELPGPPLDIAASREIDLGPVIDITVKEDDVEAMFKDDSQKKLGLQYDPTQTVIQVVDDEGLEGKMDSKSRTLSSKSSKLHSKAAMSAKSLSSRSEIQKSRMDKSRIDAKSTQSRVDQSMSQAEVSGLEESVGRLTSKVIDGSTQQSRRPSLSFAKVQAEVIHLTDEYEGEWTPVPEDLRLSSEASEFGGGETSDFTALTEGETQEIPEDITEYTDGEESVPATSVPSSAPETDVEDTVGDVTPGEEA